MNLSKMIATLTKIRNELGNHNINELIVVLDALESDLVYNSPTCGKDIHRKYNVPYDTAKSVLRRYHGCAYRGRLPYDRMLFDREQAMGNRGNKHLNHATEDAERFVKKVFGK